MAACRAARQVEIGRRIARVSPVSVYRYACEEAAGTGLPNFMDFWRRAGQYRIQLAQFVRSEDAGDPASRHLIWPEGWACGPMMSQKPVDFQAIPKFEALRRSTGESLNAAVWDIGLVLLFNAVFFLIAYVSFVRR